MVRKRFGQHFLSNAMIIDRMIKIIAPKKTEHFIEIGPGPGVLTKPLIHSGALVHAIEIDRDLGQDLQALTTQHPNFELTIADFLIWLPQHHPNHPVRWVGNLPYNITTPIFFGLLPVIPTMIDAHFMIQKEVGERLSATPNTKSYGRLSVMMQYYFDIDYCLDVPPSAFSPPPKVDSCVIRLRPKHNRSQVAVDDTLFSTLVRTAFQYRRKQLINSLKSLCDVSIIQETGLDPNMRAENLRVEDFVLLCNAVWKKLSHQSHQ